VLGITSSQATRDVHIEGEDTMKAALLQRQAEMEKIGAAFQPHMALARAILILEENTLFLLEHLEKRNFRVYTVKNDLKDEQIAPLLAHRVLVTNNPRDFLSAAAIYEFSMIDTSNAYQDPTSLAQEISDAWITMKLKGKQPFVLHLNRGGAPSLESVD
jgi:hypothetical protein